MLQNEFLARLKNNPGPVIIDLWAPWCVPCRRMEPAFKLVSQKYTGQVDIWKINADESPEVLKALRVIGIPAVVGFANGKEILRRTGIQSAETLDILFDATLHQHKPTIIPPEPIGRLIRSGVGLALIAIGWFYAQSIFLMAIGGVVLFSAFYDRCPIYRAIFPRLVAIINRSD